MDITVSMPSGVSTYVLDVAPYSGYTLTVNNAVRYYVKYCGAFGAYYTNSHGGWDAFLFEGNCKRTDNIDSHSIEKAINNTTTDFETKKYLSQIEPTYELSTGWLSDAEAANFARNLIQSTTIYIHDLEANEIFPAVIEDTEAQYKKFIDDKKLVSYTLQVKASQKQIRR